MMKRMFIKLLPVMAAVLLATSCSKDDGTEAAIDSPIDTPQQTEPVATAVKTITISGKVGKATLSKVTVADSKLQFEGGEKFTFGEEGTSDVYGDIIINDVDGYFTATLNFTDEDNLISNDGFTAELGNKPQGLSEAYDDLETAVKNAYYVIPFKVTKDDGDGTYKLAEGTLSKAAPTPTYDVKVYVQAAFIKASGSRTIKLNGTDVNVEIGKYYIVPVEAQMGSNEANKTTAGKVYAVKKLAGSISYAKTYVGKNVGDGAFTNDITQIGDGTVSYTSDQTAVATIDENGEVTIVAAGKTTITATVSEDTDGFIYDDDAKTATYTLVVAPEGCIPGLFSVESNTQVFFSKGNLQATTSDLGANWTWGFAEHQYDYIGEKAANTKINGAGPVSENGTVDLFGWVGKNHNEEWTTEGAIHGICESAKTSDYGTGDLESDWGKVFGESSPWKTLSKDQWEYLLSTRGTDLRKWREFDFGKGLVILPDGCTESIDGEWSTLEAAGAVFLPAAGFRYSASFDYVGSRGYYWSSTADGSSDAYRVYFCSGDVAPAGRSSREGGQSVRLVRPYYKSGEGQGGYVED